MFCGMRYMLFFIFVVCCRNTVGIKLFIRFNFAFIRDCRGNKSRAVICRAGVHILVVNTVKLFAVGDFLFHSLTSLLFYTARCKVMNVLFYRQFFYFENVTVHYRVGAPQLALNVG